MGRNQIEVRTRTQGPLVAVPFDVSGSIGGQDRSATRVDMARFAELRAMGSSSINDRLFVPGRCRSVACPFRPVPNSVASRHRRAAGGQPAVPQVSYTAGSLACAGLAPRDHADLSAQGAFGRQGAGRLESAGFTDVETFDRAHRQPLALLGCEAEPAQRGGGPAGVMLALQGNADQVHCVLERTQRPEGRADVVGQQQGSLGPQEAERRL